MDNVKKSKGFRISLLFKMSGISSVLIVLVLLILAIFSVRYIQISSLDAAVIIGNQKMVGDIATFQDKLAQEYGVISLKNGDLVDSQGNSLKNDYRIVDMISARLGVVATIFMRENDDYRRISTSIVDSAGKRAVDTFLGTGSAAYKPIQAGVDYFGNAVILGNNYLTAYRPLFADNSKDIIGILFVGMEMSSINAHIINSRNSNIVSIIIIAAIILLVSIIVNVASCRVILLKPIQSVIGVLQYLGNGDLTSQLKVSSRDEIGEMSDHINTTMEKIKLLILTIKNQAGILANISDDLAGNMNGTAAAVSGITGNVQKIKSRILSQSASVTQTNTTMEQLKVYINKLDDHIENLSNNISQASSAVEQMVANTRSVTDTLVNNSVNVKELLEASDVGRSGLQNMAAEIKEIAGESEGLLEINSVMNNIAGQTNLLSMNAAIEAAHAGDAGRGFAVVAAEIRKLAENSGDQSRIIGTVLKKIKESIDRISRSTENVMSGFEAIDSRIKTVSEQEEVIRNSMEEQGEGNKQLLIGVGNVIDITQLVRNSSHEMLSEAEAVLQETTNLEQVTNEISSGINEMTGSADQINTAVNQVSEISAKTKDGINTLINGVSRFKVE
ncbi:MAG: Cache 3/Cache 2 fusion domain-containing protein [Treponema sp.]|nr:Cache 3/Cache 2 fusion domain-containing protein [Treponema sp.]